jgi:hypothetical protein
VIVLKLTLNNFDGDTQENLIKFFRVAAAFDEGVNEKWDVS